MAVPRNNVFFVLGPTGSGKSALAVALAQSLPRAYVVNCDVMQMFELGCLDIATNKMTREEMRGVPHLFMNFLSPSTGRAASSPSRREQLEVAVLGEVGAILDAPERLMFSSSLQHMWRDADGSRADVDDDAYRVTDFVAEAGAVIRALWEATRLSARPLAAIVCGGTNYYAQSLLGVDELTTDACDEDLASAGPQPSPPPLPDNLHAGDLSLWEQLRAADPALAAKYHPNDTRRLRRILDIQASAPSSLCVSDLWASKRTGALRFAGPDAATHIVVVEPDNDWLRGRQDARVDAMVAAGLLREVYELSLRLATRSHTVASSIAGAIGFREFAAISPAESMPFEEWQSTHCKAIADSIQAVKNNTHRYARQQRRWIHNKLVSQYSKAAASCLSVPVGPTVPSDVLQKAAVDVAAAATSTQTAACAGGYLRDLRAVAVPTGPSPAETAVQSPLDCTVCGKLIVGEAQVRAHLQSKGHAGALRHRQLVEEQRAQGREIPSHRGKRPRGTTQL